MVKVFSRRTFGYSFATTLVCLGLGILPLSAQATMIREVTIREVKCITPSSGINNTSRGLAAALGAAVGAATATVATGASGGVLIGTYGLAIAGGAGTGVSTINGLDSFFSGTDDLYIRVNGNKVWPSSGRFVEARSQQAVGIHYTIAVNGTSAIELMEYDWVSSDDSMGILTLDAGEVNSPGGRRFGLTGPDGSIYEVALEFGIANSVGSQLISTNTGAPSISTLPRDSNGIFQIGTYLRSNNGRYRVVMQGDGNLVMYDNASNSSIWSSETGGRGPGPFRAAMQNDGNFVIYNHRDEPQWSTNTNGRGSAPYRLDLQDDRNLVLYDANNTVLWASNTMNTSFLAR